MPRLRQVSFLAPLALLLLAPESTLGQQSPRTTAPNQSPANLALSVSQAIAGGAALKGKRVLLKDCTISEADDLYLSCQEGAGGADAATILIEVKTLDRMDARRAFFHCKDDKPQSRCSAQVRGVVGLDEDGDAEIKDAKVDWRRLAELALPEPPQGALDLHDLLLAKETYQDKPVSVSGCYIRAYAGTSLECKLRPFQRWRSRQDRRAERISIDMADGKDAEWRRAFFLCHEDRRTPECEGTITGIFSESSSGFLRLRTTKIS